MAEIQFELLNGINGACENYLLSHISLRILLDKFSIRTEGSLVDMIFSRLSGEQVYVDSQEETGAEVITSSQ